MKRVALAACAGLLALAMGPPRALASQLESIWPLPAPHVRAPAQSPDSISSVLKATACSTVLAPDAGPLGSFGVCSFAWKNLLPHPIGIRSLDACVSTNRSWGSGARGSGVDIGEIPFAVVPRLVRRTTEEQAIRDGLVHDFDSLSASTAAYCCGQDKQCATDIQNTGMLWCRAPKDSSSLAPCNSGGASTLMSNGSWKVWQRARMSALPEGRISESSRPLPSLTYDVYVSPRYYKNTLQPLTNSRIVAHELGHVCVGQLRMAAARAGDPDAFALASDLGFDRTINGDGVRCRTISQHEAFYRRLAATLAMSDDTFACLKRLADDSGQNRFEAGSCQWSCANDYWEEAFADWVHFHAMPDDRWVPELIPGYCTYKRDGEHALPADTLECFLKTPAFVERLKSAVGCRP